MSAAEAKPEVDPGIAALQALFTTSRMRLHILNLAQMSAVSHYFASPDFASRIRIINRAAANLLP